MITVTDAVNKLKNKIHDDFENTKTAGRDNIFRGHLRSISTDIEDGIACFVSDVIPDNYKVLLDPSIHVNKENNRPDLLVINSNNEVVAMIEVKANMGWCRDARGVIDKILINHEKFCDVKTLRCEFSNFGDINVTYGNNVKLFLIALTSQNCPIKNHESNKLYADEKKVYYMNLFNDWYYNLSEQDIFAFANALSLL